MAEQRKDAPKQKSLKDLTVFIVIAVVLLIAGMWGGYVLDDNTRGSKINYSKALNNIEDYLTAESLINAVIGAVSGNGMSAKGAMLGGLAGVLIVAYQASITPKRFHRKGEEHGSARWGTDKEKKIIADNNDLYNNVILAADIFLVLDRKQRDKNALTEKERKQKEHEEKQKKEAEEKRKNALEAEIRAVQQTSHGGENIKLNSLKKFEYANNLNIKKAEFSADCTVIPKGAFYGCEHLEEVNAESIRIIECSAFEGCISLGEVTVGKSLKRIEDHAFDKCLGITMIGESGSYAQKYANEKNIVFKEKNGSTGTKLSIADVLKNSSKNEKIQPMLNLNMLIPGGSGTGKSRFFVKPNLMQGNTSYVITDPSGELLQTCGDMLIGMGYEIKVFNIDKMEHSSNYNPFHYVRNRNGEDDSGRDYDPNAVIKLINTFMMNTKGEGEGSGGDPFWDNATKLLLSAICFLLMEVGKEEEQNFASVLDLLHMAKVVDGKEEEKSELDLVFDERAEEDPNALSVHFYTEFKQAAGKTMQGILISTTVRLQGFNLEKIRDLTFKDTIGLDTIGDKKTALFIIIPSSDSTYNFLAAMMYTQLFDTLYDRAINYYHGRLKYHVRFILDEFANTGRIPDFEKILATCRKFEISIQVILQNLSQLKRLYEKSWEEIPGNCDTTIFLGGKDQTNNEYIMKELGKETIDTRSNNRTKGKNGSTSENDGIMGRELMQLDELATMPNNECLVLIRGLRPFRTDKFDIKYHPNYHMLGGEDHDDPAKNCYYIEKMIKTEPETDESVELLSYETNNDDLYGLDYKVYNIRCITPDGDEVTSQREIEKSLGIDKSASELFDNVEKMPYSA